MLCGNYLNYSAHAHCESRFDIHVIVTRSFPSPISIPHSLIFLKIPVFNPKWTNSKFVKYCQKLLNGTDEGLVVQRVDKATGGSLFSG